MKGPSRSWNSGILILMMLTEVSHSHLARILTVITIVSISEVARGIANAKDFSKYHASNTSFGEKGGYVM